MIPGMPIAVFIHTLLSLVGLVAGVVVLTGLFGSRRRDGWTAIFLLTLFATSASGFILPASRFLPSHGIGILSLAVLLVAVVARYRFRLAGAARWLYAVAAVLTLYLDVFVAVAQAFAKIPALKRLAPPGSQAPFAIAELAVMALFVVLAVLAARKFRPAIPDLKPTAAFSSTSP